VTDESVLLDNYWRSYRFSWDEVTEVGTGTVTMLIFPIPAIVFGLRDGGRRRAQATPSGKSRRVELIGQIKSYAPSSVRFVD